jgi:hypothetical protein
MDDLSARCAVQVLIEVLVRRSLAMKGRANIEIYPEDRRKTVSLSHAVPRILKLFRGIVRHQPINVEDHRVRKVANMSE